MLYVGYRHNTWCIAQALCWLQNKYMNHKPRSMLATELIHGASPKLYVGYRSNAWGIGQALCWLRKQYMWHEPGSMFSYRNITWGISQALFFIQKYSKSPPNNLNSCYSVCSQISMTLIFNLLLNISII